MKITNNTDSRLDNRIIIHNVGLIYMKIWGKNVSNAYVIPRSKVPTFLYSTEMKENGKSIFRQLQVNLGISFN